MNYTDLARVKLALDAQLDTDDEKLLRVIEAASRAIDRYCSGSGWGSADYFTAANVVNEEIRAFVDDQGHVSVWPHKAVINSVSAFAYRAGPIYDWTTADTGDLQIDGSQVTAWVNALSLRGAKPIYARLSYNGGFASTIDGLPADLVDAATVWAVRFYNENAAGLNDVVGVSELGAVFFSKQIPQRVSLALQPYRRMPPW